MTKYQKRKLNKFLKELAALCERFEEEPTKAGMTCHNNVALYLDIEGAVWQFNGGELIPMPKSHLLPRFLNVSAQDRDSMFKLFDLHKTEVEDAMTQTFVLTLQTDGLDGPSDMQKIAKAVEAEVPRLVRPFVHEKHPPSVKWHDPRPASKRKSNAPSPRKTRS